MEFTFQREIQRMSNNIIHNHIMCIQKGMNAQEKRIKPKQPELVWESRVWEVNWLFIFTFYIEVSVLIHFLLL